jgi:mannose-6-phosphate isomerase-like protein (cupin superfamily)
VIAAYRLFSDDSGTTHLEPVNFASDLAWENGPGEFKGVGGSVVGDATRVMLMRFEPGARPGLHRAVPSFAVVLEGELLFSASDGVHVTLKPGDAVRVETTGRGGWQLGNRGNVPAVLAVSQMPPKPTED